MKMQKRKKERKKERFLYFNRNPKRNKADKHLMAVS